MRITAIRGVLPFTCLLLFDECVMASLRSGSTSKLHAGSSVLSVMLRV
jgi:hypothetical protein